MVTTLGLLLVLQSGASMIWGGEPRRVASLLPRGTVKVFGAEFGQDRLWMAVIALTTAALLAWLYQKSGIGVATVAAVQSEKGAIISGYSPDLLGTVNFALGTALAAAAGILIAAQTTASGLVFTLLVIPAIAAALAGSFSSIMLACLAGLAIGVVQSEVARFVDISGAREAIPFLAIAFLLALRGDRLPDRASLAVGSLPSAPDIRGPKMAAWIVSAVLVTGLIVVLGDDALQFALIITAVFGVLALSLVVITGFVGQVSLAQMTFAGFGALFAAKLEGVGLPFPLSILAGALLVAPIGIAIGLPALRIRGPQLAVVTLGAAAAVDGMIFKNAKYTGGFNGTRVNEPRLFGVGIDPLSHTSRYAVFAIVVLLATTIGVWRLRRSRLGHVWLAVRRNERAAAATGINVSAVKLQAFALSATIAGLAGGLLIYAFGAITFGRFNPFASILLFAVTYVAGVGAAVGALLAGAIVAGGISTALAQEVFPWLDAETTALVTGFWLMDMSLRYSDGLALSPQAVIPPQVRRLIGRRRRGGDEEGE